MIILIIFHQVSAPTDTQIFPGVLLKRLQLVFNPAKRWVTFTLLREAEHINAIQAQLIFQGLNDGLYYMKFSPIKWWIVLHKVERILQYCSENPVI